MVKIVIKKALDATTFEGLDTLLNLNLMREADIYVHDFL